MRKSYLVQAESSGRTFDLNAIAAGSNGARVTNTERPCRLVVKIVAVRNLKKSWSSSLALKDYPIFEIKVEEQSKKSREVSSQIGEDGVLIINRSFTFDVKDPKNATLSLHVYNKGVLGVRGSLGHVKPLAVADLLQECNGGNRAYEHWYQLSSKDGSKICPGEVLIHIVAGIAEPEQNVYVFVGTWNIGNARPVKDLSSWLPKDPSYEIVAIGAQECDYQPRQGYTDCSKDWIELLKAHLGPQYKIIHGISRGQMRLIVFVRSDVEKAISERDSGSEATGVGNVIANKGGLCISFKFWDTGLCFVNCHFAAHVGQCATRNSNYREIVRQLHVGMQRMDILNQFHHVFWMGDLNYRLDFGHRENKPLSTEGSFWQDIVMQIQNGNHKDLLQYDELHKEQAAKRVFYGFNEGDLTFPPTFKMQRGMLYSFDQKRLPAWCDRVLWRSLPGCRANILSYTSAPAISCSDHKPVAATFCFTAYALPPPSISSPLDDDDKRWHLRFTSLRAKNLRASDVSGFSDPYISFIGANLFQEVTSKVRYQTLNPVWNPLQELPTLVLNVFPLQRLDREYLRIRVLHYDSTSTENILGYGVIPLAPVVSAFTRGLRGMSEFHVELSRYGLPAGILEGVMKLTWERNVMKRKLRLSNSFFEKTISFRDTSLYRTISNKIFY